MIPPPFGLSCPAFLRPALLRQLSPKEKENVDLRRPPPGPSRAAQGRPARRLRRAADRRAYERICRQLRAAARLADRLPGLGRLGGGAAGGSGDLHRRALHAAGARAGRRAALELPVGAGDQHRRLAEGACAGRGRIGYDPWLHTKRLGEAAREALAEKGAELVAGRRNPIDAVWADRRSPPRRG
jgi:hypothetical protein